MAPHLQPQDWGDEQLAAKYSHAIDLISRSLDLYGPEGLAFSFNGGKDSTVLLHLLLHAVDAWASKQPSGQNSHSHQGLAGMHVFFFLGPDEFPEVADFVQQCDKQYDLHMRMYSCSFKEGLQDVLATTQVKAIFLGTRRGDPNCKDQEFFCPSSEGWPAFMRINPILDWAYHDVWTFLLRGQFPYCRLYDCGYTSLGSVKNTSLNSALLRLDGTYAPAHLLADARLERVGRETDGYERKTGKAASHSHTASLAIIGDEILSGKVTDVNTAFIAQALHAMGWRLQIVVTLADDADAICRELRSLMESSDVVITAGGVGPTVDDVTVAAVAMAFNCRVSCNPTLEASLRRYFGSGITKAHLKMAETPEAHTELIYFKQDDGSESPFPLLKVADEQACVFVLPGVPHLLRRKWPVLAAELDRIHSVKCMPFHSRVIRLRLQDETKIAAQLARLSSQYPDVSVGSYPVTQQDDGAGILISIECKDSDQLDSAAHSFLGYLQEAQLGHSVLTIEKDPRRMLHGADATNGSCGRLLP